VNPDNRRRLGAVSALAIGVFLALALVPGLPTGPAGRSLGVWLWRTLGVGAVGIPVLCLLVGLAGFDRLRLLDMKRAALLGAGLAVLVPYGIGVIAGIAPADLDPPQSERNVTAWLTGTLPGFLGWGAVRVVGQAGGVLAGFLALTALTLGTVAWHPLRRLERSRAGPSAASRRAARDAPEAAALESDREREDGARKESEALGVVPPPRPAHQERRRTAGVSAAHTSDPLRSRGDEEEEQLLPPLDLLSLPLAQDAAADAALLDRLGDLLLEALRTFKVEGTIAGRTSGPVVTQFEVVPAPGVKVGRIVALSDDLAIKMRTPSVRVAPIPGRGAVGVEVPNPTARIVTVRELLESPEWNRSRAALPIPLGRDLEGRPVIADLTRMPHLLIAGATGSGKSVAINAIITGLVCRYTPRQLRFLMVDPKMVELSMYNALPHMRYRVVTDSHDAARALKWAVLEMGRRYELLHANGARNVADFNRKVLEGRPLRLPVRPSPLAYPLADADTAGNTQVGAAPPAAEVEAYTDGPLPYIVVIVDELADLMMTVQGEVETPLALLAQKARAIGIHLILATQRPSVNVLTGLIKANFPCRVAFRVASKVDSRTILDQNGAEALLGNGDMLFVPPGRSEPMRVQGAYIATEETERLMRWYEAHQTAAAGAVPEPDILEVVRACEAHEEEEAGPMEAGDRDPLFREAAEICIQHQGGSTSLLQRKLRIGYGRAARIIDQLHAAGILGPPDGSKPREVLIGLDQLDHYC
jgi:S-DNA-T family DNA segregation ATPase FtsK/SpoIIIE